MVEVPVEIAVAGVAAADSDVAAAVGKEFNSDIKIVKVGFSGRNVARVQGSPLYRKLT